MIESAEDEKLFESMIENQISSLKNLLNEYLQSSNVLKDDLKLYIKQQIALN